MTQVIPKIFAGLMMPFLTASSVLADTDPVTEALPLCGTAGHGHAYPGATVPFGMVQLSPDTPITGWDGCGGYYYTDDIINGFSHTHLSGTGGACMGDILLMPVVGDEWSDDNFAAKDYSSHFSHTNEQATPGYYKVFLDAPKVTAELTATTRAGFHKYQFPPDQTAHIVLDLVHGIGNGPVETSMAVENSTTISGTRISDGWGGKRAIYFVIEFSKPFDSYGIEQDGNYFAKSAGSASGKNIKALISFKAPQAKPILVKVGISGTSVEGARKNLSAEIPEWDFEQTRAAAVAQWSKIFEAVEFKTSDPKDRTTFYANLYLSCLAPTLFNDVDGTYRGVDHQNHSGSNFQNYTTFSLWDTYRAEQPLITLLHPDRVNDLIQSLVTEYNENGQHTVPIWPLWGNETWCMIGYHSAAVIADAYLKGFRGFDAEAAYQAMRDTAMQDRSGLKTYKQLGYMAAGGGRQATSHTIEYAFDDWCIARMAESLGHQDDAQLFYQRSENYRNIFDRTTGFFRGRKANGFWRQPFNVNGLVNDEYTEGDAWQYAFGAQQDVRGLIALYGGDAGLVQKLDGLFSASSVMDEKDPDPDITGLIGQYAHGNEPCHHIAYLYDYAGACDKTQQRVRQIMATLYDASPTGQCGNTDCGQMAAWYVFSALGFYPVNPDSGVYVIGSPTATKAVIHLASEKYKDRTFTVIAKNNSAENIYIQSATLNGKAYSRPWLTHEQIIAGGTLRLVMGPKPNLNWGNDLADRPPATMPADFHYAALPTPAAETGPEVKATASNVYSNEYSDYGPENAFDGDDETRWATDTTPAWIAVDLGKPKVVSGVRIDETYHRVQKFEFQYRDGGEWKTIFTGAAIGGGFEQKFAPVTASEFRLNVLTASENASINEIKLLDK